MRRSTRLVAIDDRAGLEAFAHEVRATARLDHPHVVTIYEVGEAHGMLYIVNLLVEGGNLEAVR